MNSEKHNNLFCLCENCSNPIIISKEEEINILPNTNIIQCPSCEHENRDLEGLKMYAEQSRSYAH